MNITKQAAPEGQSCENCRFCQSWHPPKRPDFIISECRRFPPSWPSGDEAAAEYPNTLPEGWCGEWRAMG